MMNTVKEMRIETVRLVIKPYKEENLVECFKLMQNVDYLNTWIWMLCPLKIIKAYLTG